MTVKDGCGDATVRNDSAENCLRDMNDGEVEESCEARRPPAVWAPSTAEVIKHNLMHIPFRNWCRITSD